MTSTTPRGIRNHNPGNIEFNPATRWQGLAVPPTDGRFCRFQAARWGIRAIARTLVTYQDRHDVRTVRGIIARWAPPHENDTGAYAAHVAAKLGVHVDTPVNVHDYAVCRPLVEAIIRHENGMQPYGDRDLDDGLRLAGIEPPVKPLRESRTVAGGALAAGGVTVTAIAEAAQQVAPAAGALRDIAQAAPWVALAIVGVAVAWMVWARIDDHRSARR